MWLCIYGGSFFFVLVVKCKFYMCDSDRHGAHWFWHVGC